MARFAARDERSRQPGLPGQASREKMPGSEARRRSADFRPSASGQGSGFFKLSSHEASEGHAPGSQPPRCHQDRTKRADLYLRSRPLRPPNAQACLPLLPMRDVFEWRALRGFEVGADGVGNGHKADLHNVGGNAKKLCRLVTTAQMEGGCPAPWKSIPPAPRKTAPPRGVEDEGGF